MNVTIYHNPRCSKSRATLALLKSRGIEPNIVEYLESPPDEPIFLDLIDMLGLPPMALVRRGEDAFGQSGLDRDETDRRRIAAALHRWPRLMQRPVVVVDGQARIGRPPENVLEIL